MKKTYERPTLTAAGSFAKMTGFAGLEGPDRLLLHRIGF